MADAPDAAVQQNTESGPGSDLPQGAAQQVNDALPSTAVSEGETLTAPSSEEMGAAGEAVAEEDTAEPELAADSDYEPAYIPEGDDDAFITGPTTRPDEGLTAGAFGQSRKGLPQDIINALPVFEEAASLPDAPPQLQVLMAALALLAES